VHLKLNALKLFHHRLDSAGAQRQFFKKRGNFSAVAMNLADIALISSTLVDSVDLANKSALRSSSFVTVSIFAGRRF
jgi:hypothetical protein